MVACRRHMEQAAAGLVDGLGAGRAVVVVWALSAAVHAGLEHARAIPPVRA